MKVHHEGMQVKPDGFEYLRNKYFDSCRRHKTALLLAKITSVDDLVDELAEERAMNDLLKEYLALMLAAKLIDEKSLAVAEYMLTFLNNDIKRGQRVKQGGKRGHEIVYGSDPEKKQLGRAIVEFCKALHKTHNRLFMSDIKRQAAKQFGVSEKTITRNVEACSGQPFRQAIGFKK